MELQELKNRINIDIEGSLTRFANMEKMYIKFLKKFREDETFEKLSKAVEEKDRRETEQAAHTLKGVCANLGLEDLRAVFDQIVQAVRSGETQRIPALYEKAKADMERTSEAIGLLA